MDNFPIQCLVCDQTLKGDQAYLAHMQNEHGTTSTSKALAKQKAIKQNVPQSVPVGKDIPPTDEFMEIAKQIDSQSKPPVVLETAPSVFKNPQQEVKPLILKYRWEGNCPECNSTVRTIMTKVDNRLFATAYCLTHDEVQQLEVHPLEHPIKTPERQVIDINEKFYEKPLSVKRVEDFVKTPQQYANKYLKKRGVTHVKRHKSVIRDNAPVSSTLPITGLSETNEPSISS